MTNNTDNQTTTPKNKKVFIITPIGNENSSINLEARGLIETIKPVLEEKSFDIDNPMDSQKPGSISQHIISEIVHDDLVVVNLTDQNPNVMYELAIRHSANKPLIIFIREDQLDSIPFDIKDQRVIPYVNQLYGANQLQSKTRGMIDLALKDDANSPIFEATKQIILKKGETQDVSISDALNDIRKKLDDIGSPSIPHGVTWSDTQDSVNVRENPTKVRNVWEAKTLSSRKSVDNSNNDGWLRR